MHRRVTVPHAGTAHPYRKPSTAGHVGTTYLKVRITHPFHPLNGRAFEVICRRRHWGEDRLVFVGDDGRFCTIASAFTDIDTMDEFRRIAAGRAAFRTADLLALFDALDRLARQLRAGNA
jgi:hypothetical protein